MKKYTKTKYKSYHPKYLTLIIAITTFVKYLTTRLTCYNPNEDVSKLKKLFLCDLDENRKHVFKFPFGTLYNDIYTPLSSGE